MATSFYFNNYGASQEQLLIESLVVESIKIYGHDAYYLPRTRIETDSILGEDSYSKFESQYFVEMYIKNVEGFAGQGDFLSKFNLEIRDQVTLTIARKAFSDEVGSQTALTRPREGDLIYMPLNGKVFEIKFVEHEAIFYQLGALQTYDLTCELFDFGSEIFNTGIPFIDNKFNNISLDMSEYALLVETGLMLRTEEGFDLVLEEYDLNVIDPGSDNEDIQSEADGILDFTEIDPFSEGVY